MALCTQADMEKLGQVDFTNEPDAAVSLYIGMAQSLVEAYCDRPFDRQVDRVDTLDGSAQASLFLPLYPVQSITSVVEDGVTLTPGTDYLLYASRGQLVRLQGNNDRVWWWDYKRQSVVVTYTAGYDDAEAGYEVPDDLRMVCASIALRIFKAEAAWAATPAAASGPVTAVTLDGVGSYSYGATSSSGVSGEVQGTQQAGGSGPALTPAEKQALSRYRRRLPAGAALYEGRW